MYTESKELLNTAPIKYQLEYEGGENEPVRYKCIAETSQSQTELLKSGWIKAIRKVTGLVEVERPDKKFIRFNVKDDQSVAISIFPNGTVMMQKGPEAVAWIGRNMKKISNEINNNVEETISWIPRVLLKITKIC